MTLVVDEVDKWTKVIESIDQDMVPIDCIKKVIFKLEGGKQRTINFSKLKTQGLGIEDIEVVVNRNLGDLGKNVDKVDFIIDVLAVAKKIKPLTKGYLEKL
jgi:hypothetical protein|tara:strand:+ start:77 stop:379 length:303 start_codon:yes stop_codon:yes gene_type:complete